MATLQQAPWKENDFPAARNLADIHDWLAPLLQEEAEGRFTGKPCPPVQVCP